MNEQLKERIDKVSRISLKEILQDFGAVFVKERQFYHPYWGNEKTPSGFIYVDKNGQEKWKHFKQGVGGDGIEFVKQVTGATSIFDALDKILGPDKTFKVRSEEEMKSYNEHLIQIKKQEDEQARKRMYAILKNSKPALATKKGLDYFEKRGLLEVIDKFYSPNIDIMLNSYKNKDGKDITSIVYLFKGNKEKGTSSFMIIKGLEKDNEGKRFKMNVRTCRPISYTSDAKAPILICEGFEDGLSALSNMFRYKNFISLNSTSGVKKMMDMMDKCPKFFNNHEFHVCFDNDKTGDMATTRLMQHAKEKGYNFKVSDISQMIKEAKVNDINDLLVHYNNIIKKTEKSIAASKER